MFEYLMEAKSIMDALCASSATIFDEKVIINYVINILMMLTEAS